MLVCAMGLYGLGSSIWSSLKFASDVHRSGDKRTQDVRFRTGGAAEVSYVLVNRQVVAQRGVDEWEREGHWTTSGWMNAVGSDVCDVWICRWGSRV